MCSLSTIFFLSLPWNIPTIVFDTNHQCYGRNLAGTRFRLLLAFTQSREGPPVRPWSPSEIITGTSERWLNRKSSTHA